MYAARLASTRQRMSSAASRIAPASSMSRAMPLWSRCSLELSLPQRPIPTSRISVPRPTSSRAGGDSWARKLWTLAYFMASLDIER